MSTVRRRRVVLTLLGLLAATTALLTLACGDDDTATATAAARATSTTTSGSDAPRVVRIGVVQSFTGAAAIYGNPVVEGIELAAKELNAESASTGIRVELTVVDDRSAAGDATTAFASLIADDVDAIIGPTLSQAAPEAHRLAQEAGVPVLGATTTAQGITDVGDFVFRVALPESVVVPATLARVAKDTPLNGAVLVLDSSDAFSRSSAAAMRSGLAAAGGSLLTEIDVATAAIDEALGRLEAEQVDVFLVTPLVETSAPVVRAIRAAGFEQPIVGGNGFNTPDIAQLAGTAIEGAYVGAAWNPGVGTETSRAFVRAFSEEYGSAPDLFAAQGYTSVYLVVDAARRAGAATPSSLRDALAQTRDLDTPLGSLSISDRREATHSSVMQRYRNGQLVVVP
ncbi:MAG: ABC transporter substrate-binding protein [Dehalococcoidia bacterium]